MTKIKINLVLPDGTEHRDLEIENNMRITGGEVGGGNGGEGEKSLQEQL